MSLIIIVCLIVIGLIPLSIMRVYEHGYMDEQDYEYKHIYKQHCREAKISEIAMTSFTGYITALILAIFGCLGAGTIWWLKDGNWLTISPELIISALTDNNIIKDLLLKETSWAGIQEINSWYLQSNLSWSFLLTFVVLILSLIFTTD